MKLNYLQLESHLSQQLLPIYLIAGEEWQLRQETLQLIRKKAKQNTFTERIRLGQETLEPENLINHLYGNSLMAEKKIVELDCRHTLPNKKILDILKDFVPNKNILLIIELGKLEAKIEKSSWVQPLEKNGALIVLWPLTFDKLLNWIKQRASKYQLNINKEALHYLAENTLGNVAAALQAIEKLYLLQSEQVIDKTLIQHIIQNDARVTVFDLVDHLLNGHIEQALQTLEMLKEESIEPVLILWALTRELRLLITLQIEQQEGISFEDLCKKHRIFFQRQQLMKKSLVRQSIKKCQQLLIKAIEVDKTIKGVMAGNSWQALQLFCLRF